MQSAHISRFVLKDISCAQGEIQILHTSYETALSPASVCTTPTAHAVNTKWRKEKGEKVVASSKQVHPFYICQHISSLVLPAKHIV